MTYRFPSEEWIQELSRQLNASEAYEKSASNWEGDFIFVVDPVPGEEPRYLYLDLYHGKSPSARELKHQDEKDAAYIITAPAATGGKLSRENLIPSRE
jgi:hypothetical protein